MLRYKSGTMSKSTKKQSGKKVRHYCLTFFTEPSIWLPTGVRYALYGIEHCKPSEEYPNGRKHWQTYVELYNSQRPSWIKKAWNDRTVHIEYREGSREQAKAYCMKEKNWTEYGKWIKGQGHRTDLETIAEGLVSGEATINEIMEQAPETYCRYRNGLRDLAALGVKKKTKKFRHIDVTLITGPTGVGKTREAAEMCQYKIEGRNMNWWQDYEGEESILIDDYDNDVPITNLLNLLDGYQLRLNIKNSHTYANWNKVYITTNLRIEELHSNAKPAHREALFRRINIIKDLWPKLDPRDEEVQG